jgi:hypothetical protein
MPCASASWEVGAGQPEASGVAAGARPAAEGGPGDLQHRAVGEVREGRSEPYAGPALPAVVPGDANSEGLFGRQLSDRSAGDARHVRVVLARDGAAVWVRWHRFRGRGLFVDRRPLRGPEGRGIEDDQRQHHSVLDRHGAREGSPGRERDADVPPVHRVGHRGRARGDWEVGSDSVPCGRGWVGQRPHGARGGRSSFRSVPAGALPGDRGGGPACLLGDVPRPSEVRGRRGVRQDQVARGSRGHAEVQEVDPVLGPGHIGEGVGGLHGRRVGGLGARRRAVDSRRLPDAGGVASSDRHHSGDHGASRLGRTTGRRPNRC